MSHLPQYVKPAFHRRCWNADKHQGMGRRLSTSNPLCPLPAVGTASQLCSDTSWQAAVTPFRGGGGASSGQVALLSSQFPERSLAVKSEHQHLEPLGPCERDAEKESNGQRSLLMSQPPLSFCHAHASPVPPPFMQWPCSALTMPAPTPSNRVV